MKRATNPSQNQLIALGVLLASAGAIFGPPLQVAAQPEGNTTGTTGAQAGGTPEPLATPLTADDEGTSVRTTRAVGTITGQGTVGNIAKFTGTNAIGNSVLFENGGKVGIGTTTPAGLFSVKGTATNVYSIYGLGAGDAILGSSSGGIGVYGQHTGTSGDQSGVSGDTSSTSANAAGVLGTILSTAPGASSAGLRGINKSTSANGYGIYGSHAGLGSGVYGTSPNGNGVLGDSTSAAGVRGRHTLGSGTAPGVSGETNSTSDSAVGVQGIINATNAGDGSAGVKGVNNATSGNGYGVYGSHAGSGYAVYGSSASGTGVGGHGGYYGMYATGGYYGVYATGTSYGLYGYSSGGNGVYGSSGSSYGVYGYSSSSNGVYGSSYSNYGIKGASTNSYGIYGTSTNSVGLYGFCSGNSGAGVVAQGYVGVQGVTSGKDVNSQGIRGDNGNSNTNGYAGVFNGRVVITGNLTVGGTLSKNAGSFRIDHPLHPATEFLSHSFVESPDMMNVYNGNTKTNSKGEVWVTLPNYFRALNRDFRYQLTPMGQFAQAIVGQKITGNRFLIRTDKPNVEVSWQVTGIRQDAYARDHRIKVEETKTGDERGRYLYPAGFGAGPDKLIAPPAPRLASRPRDTN